MALTQRQHLLQLFHENGNRLTLGQILKTTLAAEYRARLSEMRRDNYIITCTKGETPSQNLYVLTEPVQYQFDGPQGILFWEAMG